ncbi:hypothetical protein WMY93_027928 [Mugilogobius chulae]|uniref:C-type lectin domain-containing protein n=1 Tax=Mugilogobius chulae TaxID=88201 RepID=A0AAW0MYN0_9GOBI
MKKIILMLWLSSGPVHTSIVQQGIWYKPYPRTWTDARTNCRREHNGDLAILRENEATEMYMTTFYAWIGLRKSNSNWYWDKGTSVQDVQSTFITPTSNKECGQALFNTAQPLDDDCANLHFFYCRYYVLSLFYDVFVPQTKTWDGAKEYCVEQSYEFITVTSDNDLQSSPFYIVRNFPVWFGQFHNSDCGVVWSENKSLSSQSCSEAFPYLCSVHNVRLVQEHLTWEQSYQHCKSLKPDTYSSYELVSGDAQDLQFFQFAANNATTDKVWLGLRFIGESWFWSDGSVVSFPDLPSCPKPKLHCGALVMNRLSSISKPVVEPSDCSDTLNLLCYGF